MGGGCAGNGEPVAELKESPVNTPNLDEVQLTGMDSSYTFDGPYGLKGALAYGDRGPWILKGALTFPTGGYTVEGPDVRVLKRLPEHVIITFTVTPPPEDAMVTQALTEEPFRSEIYVSEDATFTMVVETAQSD